MSLTLGNSRHRLRHLRVGLVLTGFLLTGCPGDSGNDLSGTYVAKENEGTMTLEFKSGHKVHFIIQPTGGQPDASDGDYMINGNKVTLQIPGGIPVELVRNGKTLEGGMMGQIMHFNKK